jgi:Spy/CpxP family protein refolding chaperone
MNRSIKFVGAAALALGLAGVGLAADGGRGFGGPEGRMHGRHGGRGMRELNLTEAQREQLKAMHQQQREALKPVMEQQRQLREQIEQALAAGNADASRIGQLTIQSYQLRQQMKAEREKARAAFVNVLTPEQKAQWEKREQEHKQRTEKFGGRRDERDEPND